MVTRKREMQSLGEISLHFFEYIAQSIEFRDIICSFSFRKPVGIKFLAQIRCDELVERIWILAVVERKHAGYKVPVDIRKPRGGARTAEVEYLPAGKSDPWTMTGQRAVGYHRT
jgi:hypothetical protein